MLSIGSPFLCCLADAAHTRREIEPVTVSNQVNVLTTARPPGFEWDETVEIDGEILLSAEAGVRGADAVGFVGDGLLGRSPERALWRESPEPSAEEVFADFCERQSGVPIRPSSSECQQLSERCADLDMVAVAAAAVGQLSWAASGQLAWQPRVRALCALCVFAESSSHLRRAARLALEEAETLIAHLAAHVADCRLDAEEALVHLSKLRVQEELEREDDERFAKLRGVTHEHRRLVFGSSSPGVGADSCRVVAPLELQIRRGGDAHPESFLYDRRCSRILRSQRRQQRQQGRAGADVAVAHALPPPQPWKGRVAEV